jgi:hypothetical protein
VRSFNTAGPCIPEWHYTLPPEPRLPEARRLIASSQYFVVHAPRQTGKTTTLAALAHQLTAEGTHVAVKSVRLGDFTEPDLRALYAQHTEETGQAFKEEALVRAWEYSQGQPWLVNAIAREVIEEIGVEPPEPITVEHIDQAKERLIRARATHLDSLAARLAEPRVRRVLQPLISGGLPEVDEAFDDDVAYLRDLGLISPGWPVAMANPIYREVIVRVLGSRVEGVITADPRGFVLSDGRLDFRRLLEEFACFWRQHGEMLTSTSFYHEAAHQIVIMAFLHRIVNGGGYVEREIGVGRGRIDLLVRWPYTDGDGKRGWQREAMELKAWSSERPDPLPEGLRQLDDYLTRLDLDRGTLVVFDQRRETKPIAERTELTVTRTPTGRQVTLLRA